MKKIKRFPLRRFRLRTESAFEEAQFSPSEDRKTVSFAKEQVNFNVIRISAGETKFDVSFAASRMPAKVPGN